MKQVQLREIAHCRSGEKGDCSNISVIAYNPDDYDLLRSQVTVKAVTALYGPIAKGGILRYEVPLIAALNFVLEKSLDGGRSRTLAFDESGKALSARMLTLVIEAPDSYLERSAKLLKDAGK